MINELQQLTDVPNWRFFAEEGSILGRRGLTDRDIEVDLNEFDRLRTSEAVTTQVFAYTSFAGLRPIHARIDKALRKQREVGEVFHVDERSTFLTRFSSNWGSELKELLTQIEGWSAALNLERSVSAFAATRPDGPSVPQINHLVGLAYLGDFTTLEEYARTFAKGFRLNFVPMITREVIEAALEVSYDYFVERKAEAERIGAGNRSQPSEPGASPSQSAAGSGA